MLNLTEAQHAAIHEHERNLIVVAGAGSGKTFVLVERFLNLLDEHPDWSLNALVAITFTKKAAQEMRDRVRQALEQRYISAQTPEGREVWSKRITAMDSARIDTIHGLCASILRANAAQAGVDPGFEVLDEVDARLLLDDVIESVLQAAARENPEPLSPRSFPRVQGKGSKSRIDEHETNLPTTSVTRLLVEYEINTVRRTLETLIGEDIEDIPEDVLKGWQTAWERGAAESIGGLRENPGYQMGSDWMPEKGWPQDSDDKLMSVWAGCWSLLETIERGENITNCLEAMERLQQIIKLNVGSAGNWGGKEGLTIAKDRLRSIREAVTTALESIGNPPGELDQKAAALLPLWVSLIRQAQAAYWQQKQDNSLLDFNDLERLTHDLLAEHPAIRRRYQGAEFRHVLVDEFQDTNPAQWAIVRGLAEVEQPGSLFVVGDPKQSIYMFRNADVSVFEAVKGQITQAGGGEVALATSFRTHQPLVAAFNAIFRHVLRRDEQSPVRKYEVELGEAMQATREEAPSDEAPIEVILIDKDLLEGENDAEMRRRWEAYEVARRLRTLVEVEKRLVYDKQLKQQRPIGYGDMAILFQSMSNITLYEDVFKSSGLPFVTVSGRGYYNRQEVWDVLALLTALHNPNDDLALATALRSPLFGLSDDTLLTLRLQRDENNERLPLWEALENTIEVPEDEQARLTFAHNCLQRLHSLAGRVTIAELLRVALDETGYLAVLTGLPDGARRRGNVEKLLDKAESSGQVTLGAFNQYLRDLSTREVREGEAAVDVKDAVTLMTVHASKGLEYPLVALVDSGWSRGSRNSTTVMLDREYGLTCKVYDAQTDKLEDSYAYAQAARLLDLRETAERKRLLYVAATRAQDYLLLSGQMPATKDGAWKETTWLGWLWDALEFDGQDFTAGSRLLDAYGWGKVKVTIPEQMPPKRDFDAETSESASGWELAAVREGLPLPGEAAAPLLGDIQLERSAIARHITATQIADLGAAQFDPFYRHKFRRSILQDAPNSIEQVSARQPITVSQRIIGEMVHKVLGWWRFPDGQADFDRILDSYAWQLGVVDEGQRKYAVQEAHKLIDRMLKSEVYSWLTDAKPIYRELPFVYRTDKRIIHGVLDVLFQQKGGDQRWAVVDYKTSHVNGYQTVADKHLVEAHAQRFHLQVGVYAAAARQQLKAEFGDIVPDVYIYYIRYGQYVKVETAAWQRALSELENTIGDLLVDEKS